MFSYDSELAAAVRTPAHSISDVIRALRTIDAICVDNDGLKWFNWLYLQVTEAVSAQVNAGGFTSAAWLAILDVQFAQLYFDALVFTPEALRHLAAQVGRIQQGRISVYLTYSFVTLLTLLFFAR